MAPRILIIDDSSLVRNLVRRHLESEPGWQVCGEAKDGREGIERALDLHPNLIVLDLSMPVMNGLEAAKSLHKLMPAVPLIMYTSFTTKHLKEEVLAAGVSRVVEKSESVSDLISAVRLLVATEAA
jgi:DNA-binding NarL/FixJ family response regulator